MILNSEDGMQIACDEWLQVREHCISGAGAGLMSDYRAPSERLFAAFIRDFHCEDFTVMARWPEKNLRVRG